MERKEKIVAGAAIGLVLYTLVLAMIGPMVSSALANRTVSNAGSVKAIGVDVYWDQACTNPVSSINWGTLDPGSNKSTTIYIKNTGNSPITLAMTTSNWNPSNASNYMTLIWNYGGQTLNANEVIQARFTLTVSSNITGITNFSFDITITANE
ncbi:MAG TPA: hypothetical protein VJ249_08400 [Candidatus Bathyarchaeia archaeon]|nr:hypothetical protein [Candidatus Bathyarchaeia archaeon]